MNGLIATGLIAGERVHQASPTPEAQQRIQRPDAHQEPQTNGTESDLITGETGND